MKLNNNILVIIIVCLMFISVSLPVFVYLQNSHNIVDKKVDGGAVASISVFVPAECGDGICELDEVCSNCPADCGVCVCGDGTCDANESCSSCPTDCGSCPSVGEGGTTGGRTVSLPSFEFDPWYFEEDLHPGESVLRAIILRNLGPYAGIELSIKDLNEFIALSKSQIWLAQGESEIFNFEINIPSNLAPSVYVGQIEGISEGVKEVFPITLNIRELESLFRVYVTLPSEREIYKPNEVITAEVSIVNLGDPAFVDASFYLTNLEGFKIDETNEKLFMDQGTNKVSESFILSSDIRPGYYLFFTKVLYDGEEYMDTRIFQIESPLEVVEFPLGKYLDQGQIVLFFALLFLIFYLARYYVKKQKKTSKKRK